jgi:uncharacterized protein (TIGR03067 family)
MRSKCFGLAVITLVATVGTVLASSMQTGDDVLKKIQGTWKFTEHMMNGQAVPAEQLKDMTITFSGDKFTVRTGDQVVQAGTHKFDPSTKPGHVDAAVTEGEGKGNTMLGIYELRGDTIRVCFDPMGKERPTSFTAKDNQMSATVKRVKK